ncbi:uncharacterized protein LOC109857823 [Pseudomyrmex gracilis]|uniref:uncharacterized protein LOC109857823 n=1 Tax=Pseudomyrmex gracilis TaxID=219809 RepID=UPI0009956DCD|nr:uncharacterized protein LOC109857823 [Pseudomyrmex gracilis]
MAQLYYECNFEIRNDNNSNAIKPYICTPEYCLYCCCDSHCCFVVQRRPSRHIWEIWYFWLGVALLAVFVISSHLSLRNKAPLCRRAFARPIVRRVTFRCMYFITSGLLYTLMTPRTTALQYI